MKKIRVAILIDAWYPFTGGAQEHIREITPLLSEKCEFNLFHAANSDLITRAIWSLAVIPKVYFSHKVKKFDLIHAHSYISGIPGKILSMTMQIPVVYTVHGSHSLDLFAYKKKAKSEINLPKWKYLLEKYLLTKIKYDYQITVSSNFLKYKNINQRVKVIPNGVNIEQFDSIRATKHRQFTLIFVGRDDPIKGVEYLHKAMKLVKRKYPEIKLTIVSGGKITGKKLVSLYKSSHLFVLPSLAEGQPLTLLEAWAAKLPVIVTRVGDNPSMVKNGVNGCLVPPAEKKALAKAIIKAYNNPNLEQLGKAGYNLVRKQYTWEKAASKTLKIYKEVMNGSR